MTQDADCIFCRIVRGEIPCHKVFEDGLFIGFLDIFPMDRGHALLVPVVHAENILELPGEYEAGLGKAIAALGAKLQETTGAVGLNVSSNIGVRAGQVVKHAHIHIIPRYKGEGPLNWQPKEGDSALLSELAKTILG